MNILVLGDVVGPSGVLAIKKNLPKIISEKKVDFVILNGENAANNGLGISKQNSEDFFNAGADVITSGTIFGIKKKQQNSLKMKKDY